MTFRGDRIHLQQARLPAPFQTCAVHKQLKLAVLVLLVVATTCFHGQRLINRYVHSSGARAVPPRGQASSAGSLKEISVPGRLSPSDQVGAYSHTIPGSGRQVPREQGQAPRRDGQVPHRDHKLGTLEGTDGTQKRGRDELLRRHTQERDAVKDHAGGETAIDMFVGILTVPRNVQERLALRKAFEVLSGEYSVVHRFLVTPDELKLMPTTELEEYHDIGVTEFGADYIEILNKTAAVFSYPWGTWVPRYVAKMDDDNIMFPTRVLRDLDATCPREEDGGCCYAGKLRMRAESEQDQTQVWENSAYYMQTGVTSYMPYMEGGAYVLSASAAMYIHANRRILKLLPIEDATVGLWLAPTACTRVGSWQKYVKLAPDQGRMPMLWEKGMLCKDPTRATRRGGRPVPTDAEALRADAYIWETSDPVLSIHKLPADVMLYVAGLVDKCDNGGAHAADIEEAWGGLRSDAARVAGST